MLGNLNGFFSRFLTKDAVKRGTLAAETLPSHLGSVSAAPMVMSSVATLLHTVKLRILLFDAEAQLIKVRTPPKISHFYPCSARTNSVQTNLGVFPVTHTAGPSFLISHLTFCF